MPPEEAAKKRKDGRRHEMPPLQRRGPRGRGTKERASFWRHLRAPAGGAAPGSRTLFGGEDCLSEARNFVVVGAASHAARRSRDGKRHETEGRMRCGHYRGGVAEGEGKKRASFWRHFMAPAGGAAPGSRNLFGGEDCLSEARNFVVVGAASHAARRGRQETESAMRRKAA